MHSFPSFDAFKTDLNLSFFSGRRFQSFLGKTLKEPDLKMGEGWATPWVINTLAFFLAGGPWPPGQEHTDEDNNEREFSSHQNTQHILKSGAHGCGLRLGGATKTRADVFVEGKAKKDRVVEALPLRSRRHKPGKDRGGRKCC